VYPGGRDAEGEDGVFGYPDASGLDEYDRWMIRSRPPDWVRSGRGFDVFDVLDPGLPQPEGSALPAADECVEVEREGSVGPRRGRTSGLFSGVAGLVASGAGWRLAGFSCGWSRCRSRGWRSW